MTVELLIDAGPLETRALLVRNGRIEDLIWTAPDVPDRTGNVYIGRVRGLDPNGGAAFVDIDAGEIGQLRLSKGDVAAEGRAVLVAIEAEAPAHEPDKGPRLTRRPILAGRFVALRPGGQGLKLHPGLTLDPAAAAMVQEAFAQGLTPEAGITLLPTLAGGAYAEAHREIAHLRDCWHEAEAALAAGGPPRLLWARDDPWRRMLTELTPHDLDRVVVAPSKALMRVHTQALRWRPELADRVTGPRGVGPALPPEIDDAADELAEAAVPLGEGARLWIERTRAGVVVDVDGGGLTAAEANRRAGAALARQLRLRRLGGHIWIDGVGSADKRKHLAQALSTAAAADPDLGDVIGPSRLGTVEVTRRRAGPAVEDVTGSPGDRRARFVASRIVRMAPRLLVDAPGAAARIEAAPEVAAFLTRDGGAPLAVAAQMAGRTLRVLANPGRPREDWDAIPE